MIATDNLLIKLHSTLDQLHQIWDLAGLSDELRDDRVKTFYDLQIGLLDEMVKMICLLMLQTFLVGFGREDAQRIV